MSDVIVKSYVHTYKKLAPDYKARGGEITVVTYELADEPGYLYSHRLEGHISEITPMVVAQIRAAHANRGMKKSKSYPPEPAAPASVSTATNETVNFRYEGDKADHKNLMCVFTYRDKEYRFSYEYYNNLADLFAVPAALRKYMLFGAKMKHNPY